MQNPNDFDSNDNLDPVNNDRTQYASISDADDDALIDAMLNNKAAFNLYHQDDQEPEINVDTTPPKTLSTSVSSLFSESLSKAASIPTYVLNRITKDELTRDVIKTLFSTLIVYILILTPINLLMGYASGKCSKDTVTPENYLQMLGIPEPVTESLIQYLALDDITWGGAFLANFVYYFSAILEVFAFRALVTHYLNPAKVGYKKAALNNLIVVFGGISVLSNLTAMLGGGDRLALALFTTAINMPPTWLFFLKELAKRDRTKEINGDIILFELTRDLLKVHQKQQIKIILKALAEMYKFRTEDEPLEEVADIINFIVPETQAIKHHETPHAISSLNYKLANKLEGLSDTQIKDLCLKIKFVTLSHDDQYSFYTDAAATCGIDIDNIHTALDFSDESEVITKINALLADDEELSIRFNKHLNEQLGNEMRRPADSFAKKNLERFFAILGALGGFYGWYGTAYAGIRYTPATNWGHMLDILLYLLAIPLMVCSIIMYKQAGEALFNLFYNLPNNLKEAFKQPALLFSGYCILSLFAFVCLAVSGNCVMGLSEASWQGFAWGYWNSLMQYLLGDTANNVLRIFFNADTNLMTTSVNVLLTSLNWAFFALTLFYNLICLLAGKLPTQDSIYTLSAFFDGKANFLKTMPPGTPTYAQNANSEVYTDSIETGKKKGTAVLMDDVNDESIANNDETADSREPLLMKDTTVNRDSKVKEPSKGFFHSISDTGYGLWTSVSSTVASICGNANTAEYETINGEERDYSLS